VYLFRIPKADISFRLILVFKDREKKEKINRGAAERQSRVKRDQYHELRFE